jgi:hypothetical protein
MIISHKHKFIFIKPQKTAGTSVELMLSRICGDKDIITPLGFDPDPNVREKHKAKPPQNYYRAKPLKNWKMSELFWFLIKWRKPNLNYWEHIQADEIREYVGNDIWNSYKKISIVRNPWDHAVSQYLWVKKFGFKKGDYDFEKYLDTSYVSLFPFYFIGGEYIVDEMLCFENLKEDTQNLLEKLNVSKPIEMPITKNKVRKNKNYSDFYTEKMIDKIFKKNEILIKQFYYGFNV